MPHPVSRSKDIAIVCLALSTGAMAFVAWRQGLELRRLARGAAPAAAPGAGVTVHSGRARTFTLAPRHTDSDTEASPPAAPDGGPGWGWRPAGPARAEPARPRRLSALARLMENGEFVQALGVQRHALLDARFAGLFRQLNLEAEELAQFKHLLAEKENVVLDVVTVSETSPEGPLSPDVLRASVRAAQAQVEQAIQSSLGGERYAIYRDYERTLPQRALVAQLEQRLGYTSAPLTPAQADALVKILGAAAPAAAAETAPALAVVVRAGVPEAVPLPPTSAATGRVTEQAVAQAQAVLTPAQVDALRQIQSEQFAAAKAADMIRGAAAAGPETAAVALTLLLQ